MRFLSVHERPNGCVWSRLSAPITECVCFWSPLLHTTLSLDCHYRPVPTTLHHHQQHRHANGHQEDGNEDGERWTVTVYGVFNLPMWSAQHSLSWALSIAPLVGSVLMLKLLKLISSQCTVESSIRLPTWWAVKLGHLGKSVKVPPPPMWSVLVDHSDQI